MKLAEIPQIIELLKQECVITAEQQGKVVSALNKAQKDGQRKFAGEMAVELGIINKETLDKYLVEQTARKAEAAVLDIQDIAEHGKQEAPKWLIANWGNNGVNPAPKEPTLADAVSAAANMAQNIVMIANDNPNIAEKMKTAISAAANLARGINDGSSSRVPLSDRSNVWMTQIREGLINCIEDTGYKPKDRGGVEIGIQEYVAERMKEVEAGIVIALGKGQSNQRQR